MFKLFLLILTLFMVGSVTCGKKQKGDSCWSTSECDTGLKCRLQTGFWFGCE